MNRKFRIFSILAVLMLCATFVISCDNKTPSGEPNTPPNGETVNVELKTGVELKEVIDIYQTTFKKVDLTKYVNANGVTGLTYEVVVDGTEAISTSTVKDDNSVVVFSTGVVGDFNLKVTVKHSGEKALEFTLVISVQDLSPDPTVIKDIEDFNLEAPVFSDNTIYVEKVIDLSEYFDAADTVSYELECEDSTVSMSLDGKKATFVFKSVGEKNLKIHAIKNGNNIVAIDFKVTLEKSVNH